MPIRILLTALLAVVLQGAVWAQESKPDAGESASSEDLEYVYMSTSLGDILLELDRGKAPISVENFMKYVEDKAYDGTIFHRVIPTFMIQGGGFQPDMTKRETRDPIENEWQNGLKNDRGTIAMARLPDPDTATNQFFINVVDNARLDAPVSGGAGYAVFGKVIAGMETVDRIRVVPTTTKNRMQNVPVEPVVIESVREIEAGQVEKAKERVSEREAKLESEAKAKAEEAERADREKALALLREKGVETEGGTLLDSGVWTVVTKEGKGETPEPASDVTVHYTGWFVDGKKFDSSHDRGQPLTLQLSRFVPGFTEGVGKMKRGERRYIVIPYQLAYGARGGNGIPPKAMLVFEVDLIDFE